MTNIVNQYDRTRAHENALNILRHFLDRAWDAQQIARYAKTPEDAIRECNKLSSLASKAQQAAQVWKGLYLDWQQHEVKAQEGQHPAPLGFEQQSPAPVPAPPQVASEDPGF